VGLGPGRLSAGLCASRLLGLIAGAWMFRVTEIIACRVSFYPNLRVLTVALRIATYVQREMCQPNRFLFWPLVPITPRRTNRMLRDLLARPQDLESFPGKLFRGSRCAGRKKEVAEMFTPPSRRLGGAFELVYTRAPEGGKVVLRARITRLPDLSRSAQKERAQGSDSKQFTVSRKPGERADRRYLLTAARRRIAILIPRIFC
jgi:hypothetical protein